MKKKLTLSALLLAFLAVSSAVTACGDEKKDPQNSDTKTADTKDTAEVRQLDSVGDLENLDFGGYTLHIDISVESNEWPSSSPYLYAQKDSADTVMDLAYRRNLEIEEALNVNVEWKETDLFYDEVEEYVTKQTLSGDAETDMFINDLAMMHRAMLKGSIIDIDGLDTDDLYFDFTAKGWQEEFMHKVSVLENRRFFLIGDYFLDSIRAANVVFVNKQIMNNHFEGMDELYTLVENGGWTLEKYAGYVKECYQDKNGSGTPDDGDMFGTIFNVNWAGLFFCSTGCRSVSWDKDGVPQLDPTVEMTSKVTDILLDITASPACRDINKNEFSNGNYLFSNWLKIADFEEAGMRNMEEVGIIPYPKYDEAQENYLTSIHSNAEVGAIPVSVNPESFGPLSAYVQAQTLYSTEYILPAYYETALKIKYSRDSQSARMLDIIRDGMTVPYEYVYAKKTGDIGMNAIVESLKNKTNTVSSFVDSHYKAEETKLAEMIKAVEEIE